MNRRCSGQAGLSVVLAVINLALNASCSGSVSTSISWVVAAAARAGGSDRGQRKRPVFRRWLGSAGEPQRQVRRQLKARSGASCRRRRHCGKDAPVPARACAAAAPAPVPKCGIGAGSRTGGRVAWSWTMAAGRRGEVTHRLAPAHLQRTSASESSFRAGRAGVRLDSVPPGAPAAAPERRADQRADRQPERLRHVNFSLRKRNGRRVRRAAASPRQREDLSGGRSSMPTSGRSRVQPRARRPPSRAHQRYPASSAAGTGLPLHHAPGMIDHGRSSGPGRPGRIDARWRSQPDLYRCARAARRPARITEYRR